MVKRGWFAAGMMHFLCPQGYTILESLPPSSGQGTAGSFSRSVCFHNTHVLSPRDELLDTAHAGGCGIPGPAGTCRRTQGKGMRALLVSFCPLSAPSSGTVWALQAFSSTSVMHECTRPLQSQALPLGWLRSASSCRIQPFILTILTLQVPTSHSTRQP